MEEEKREHMLKMKKMEQEMEEVFKMKVQEKKQKLQDSEADVRKFFTFQKQKLYRFVLQNMKNHISNWLIVQNLNIADGRVFSINPLTFLLTLQRNHQNKAKSSRDACIAMRILEKNAQF